MSFVILIIQYVTETGNDTIACHIASIRSWVSKPHEHFVEKKRVLFRPRELSNEAQYPYSRIIPAFKIVLLVLKDVWDRV